MSKQSVIHGFFKRKSTEDNLNSNITSGVNLEEPLPHEEEAERLLKSQKVEKKKCVRDSVIQDPGQRPPIWEFPVNQRDEIRHAYLEDGPFQHILLKYPTSGPDYHPRRFCQTWFDLFPDWLEYSPTKDAAFCLLCYVSDSPGNRKSNAFTSQGFHSWGKVRQGSNCAFLKHTGTDHNAPHQRAIEYCKNLMNQTCHIEKVFERQSVKDVENNRLRVKASVDTACWLAYQGCAFRGNNESSNSVNQGNFLEMIKLLALYNDDVKAAVEILRCFTKRVQNYICEEIGEAKFCIIVDEARDESKKEQMAIVVRFVDGNGYVRERFLDIIHVKDTSALTLRKEIFDALLQHNLSVENIRGQGYDGASNMRGEWNDLQALLLEKCKYAYYVHCFAHRLQLTLVAASRDVIPVYHFFSKLTIAINIVCASSKRNDELHDAQIKEIEQRTQNDETDIGRGLNQVYSLIRPGDTRWSSHYYSVSRFLSIFNPICLVINNVVIEGSSSQRAKADGIYDAFKSFEFVFLLHLMEELLGISDSLCQALQHKSQDILNAMSLVMSTKSLIQNLRDNGWDTLVKKVIIFCEKHEIDIPDFNASYASGKSRRHQQDHTVGHHYSVDIFLNAIDTQLQELESRFNDKVVKLLTLSQALDPRDKFKSFKQEKICNLVDLFYPEDFTDSEKTDLRYQLQHYEVCIIKEHAFHNISTLGELCQKLVVTGKMSIYPLVYRLICLVLTLLVSTATSERAFSAMRIIKNRLRNKMNDRFLTDCMVVYIEKEIARSITTDQLVEDFSRMKERRALF